MSLEPFQHGVASGDVSGTKGTIWTRVSDGKPGEDVSWRLEDEASGSLVQSGKSQISAGSDQTVNVHLDDLKPARRYRYQFAYRGVLSPPGRFRTFDSSAVTIRFGVACCAKFNAGFFNAYRDMASEDLDFLMHLGDYIYETSNTPPSSQTPGASIGRDFEPPGECRTLPEYRSRYSQYRRDPDVQALHSSTPIWATIDDHEIADNAWACGADEHRDQEHGHFADRLDAALRAWHEWMPVTGSTGDRPSSIYRTWTVGDLATFVLLEARTARSGPAAEEGERTELGPAQLEWLEGVVADCSTPWLVVGSPSKMGSIWSPDHEPLAIDALATLKLVSPDGGAPFHDLWDSYSAERQHVSEILSKAKSQAIIVSGDVHISVDSLTAVGDNLLPEWTAPSITSQNLDDKKGWARGTRSRAAQKSVLSTNREWRFCDFDEHGYMIIELDPMTAACEWRYVDSILESSDRTHVGHRATFHL